MATLEELLSGQTEQDYLADSGFYRGAVGLSKMPTPAARNSTEAFLLPLLQGLGAGGLAALGKNQAADQAYEDYSQNPLLQALSSEANIGPVASGDIYADALQHDYSKEERPEGWTAKTGKADLIEALREDEEKKNNTKMALSAIFSANPNLALSYAGENGVDIGGLLNGMGGETADINQYEIKQSVAKQRALDNEKGGFFAKLPAAAQQQMASAEGTIAELKHLADEFKKLDQSALEFQTKSSFSGTDTNNLTAKMNALVPTVVRLMGDVGNLGQQEQERILKATIGNLTSGSEGVATRLKNLAEMAKRMSDERLNTYKDQFSAGQTQTDDSPPSPPAGYELTGNRRANGDWGMRKIK